MNDIHDTLDFTGPEVVELLIRHDGKVVWINIDGICRLRACQIKTVILQDDRVQDRDYEKT